mmetsp:Transcript_28854/g.43571  ORF Transcript_28854/g.43571 Transcript_28854/m.43571 type:complete len:643 (+) Transcript_28854:144-2072(+)|eukprot:CAMPEP_0178910082 /NCGR_PEP_ID=MMETSP0786-20121207/8898_1 /TAXON_ID=186022 /ORGANISM="Thalassionema frauenfeldii, Strain CCMP 1798" /LENGTH=642 /DNA_ID=CAMNT_0020582291 /DNA_START=44 /DNA_END=1972 /DNA_ORIENTATION=-
MRRRIYPSNDDSLPSSMSPEDEKEYVVTSRYQKSHLMKTNHTHKTITPKKAIVLVTMFLFLTSIFFLVKYNFPKHRYWRLLKIPEIQALLAESPAAIDDQYIVFVTNANGKATCNVAWAKSKHSAESAFESALRKIPFKSARFPWFKVDVVSATRIIDNYDFSFKHNDVPSWWYGLAFDWGKGWVFLPDEIQAHGLVNFKNQVQWDRLGKYASERKLSSWPDTVLEDDETTLASLELLHTNSLFIDFSRDEVVQLYHGHRLFEKLTHGLLLEAAIEAGNYLSRHVREDGKMLYIYQPRSDSESTDYSLTHHAGAVYSMASLHQEYPDKQLQGATKQALEFLLSFVHDCPLPFDPKRQAKCVWDYEDSSHHATKLGLNALTVLAIAEYTHSTKDLQYFELARSIATFIVSSQHEDGSFVQKVSEPNNKVDEEYYVRYYQGEVIFGLARLYSVAKKMKLPEEKKWIAVADKAATCIVEREANLSEDELLVDHWFLCGIAEMGSRNKKHIHHCRRTILSETGRQLRETSEDQDRDRLGIFGASISSSATAAKTEGLCAMHNLFAKKDPEFGARIFEAVTLSTRFQMQMQYRPEKAMYLENPIQVLGGIHMSLTNYEMRIDYSQHNICAFLCMAKLLKEHQVAWSK